MNYLIDTKVVSELRKRQANPGVLSWFSNLKEDQIFISVLTMGEIRRGVESLTRRDPEAGSNLNQWMARIVMGFEDRIVPIDSTIAEEWGRLNVPDPIAVVDGLLAATAKIRGMTLATRNVKDVARTGVEVINPFD